MQVGRRATTGVENRTSRHVLTAFLPPSPDVKLLPVPQDTSHKTLTQKEPDMPAILAFQTLPAQTATTHEAAPALSISSCDSNSCRR
jgi:hypothetical protein